MIVITTDSDLQEKFKAFKNIVVTDAFAPWNEEPFIDEDFIICIGLDLARERHKKAKLGINSISKKKVYVFRSFEEGMTPAEFKQLKTFVSEEAEFSEPDWEYTLVSSRQELEEFVRETEKAEVLTIDIETNYDRKEDISNPFYKGNPEILMVQVYADPQDKTWVVPLAHHERDISLPLEDVEEALRKVLARGGTRATVGQFGYYDRMWCRAVLGIEIPFTDDTKILHQLVTYASEENSLAYMTKKFLKISYKDKVNSWLDKYKKTGWAEVPLKIMAPYGAWDAKATGLIFRLLEDELKKDEQVYSFYRNTLIPVNNSLNDMTCEGIAVDVFFHRYLASLCERRAKKYDSLIRELLRKRNYKNVDDINFSSTKQLGTLLYDDLKILKVDSEGEDKGKNSVTVSKMLSAVNEDILIILLYLYKKYVKLAATISGTYLEFLSPSLHSDKKVFMHPSFTIGGAITGRCSSSTPNGQNIDKQFGVKRLFVPSKVAEAKYRVFKVLARYGMEDIY